MVTVRELWFAVGYQQLWHQRLNFSRVELNECDETHLNTSRWTLSLIPVRGGRLWTPMKRKKGKRKPNETVILPGFSVQMSAFIKDPELPLTIKWWFLILLLFTHVFFIWLCVQITPLVVNFSLYFLVSVKISFLNVILCVYVCYLWIRWSLFVC